jgi:hypothetical protein
MKYGKLITTAVLAAMLGLVACSTGLTGSNNVTPPPGETPEVFTASTPVVIASTQNNWANTNKPIFVAFSHDMDAATITPSTFFIDEVQTQSVWYDATNRIAYLRPGHDLALGTTYHVTVAANVKTTSGTPLATPHRFTFMTRTTVGGQSPPTVIEVNEECVDDEGVIRVKFSEAMDTSTINTDTFLVSGVTGTVSYDALTFIATFTPDTPLATGGSYTATITTGVADLGGVHLQADYVFEVDICPDDTPSTYCSFTKGGYQGGGEPGQFFDEHFSTVFASDLTIGINDGAGSQHHHRWTPDAPGPENLKAYLVSPAGASTALPSDAVNPTATTSGQLSEQVVALTLNVAFSGVDGMPAGFGDQILVNTGTSLDGASIEQILAIANNSLAGNGLPVGYSFSDLNELITNLNESWDNCQQSAWAAEHLQDPPTAE